MRYATLGLHRILRRQMRQPAKDKKSVFGRVALLRIDIRQERLLCLPVPTPDPRIPRKRRNAALVDCDSRVKNERQLRRGSDLSSARRQCRRRTCCEFAVRLGWASLLFPEPPRASRTCKPGQLGAASLANSQLRRPTLFARRETQDGQVTRASN